MTPLDCLALSVALVLLCCAGMWAITRAQDLAHAYGYGELLLALSGAALALRLPKHWPNWKPSWETCAYDWARPSGTDYQTHAMP